MSMNDENIAAGSKEYAEHLAEQCRAMQAFCKLLQEEAVVLASTAEQHGALIPLTETKHRQATHLEQLEQQRRGIAERQRQNAEQTDDDLAAALGCRGAWRELITTTRQAHRHHTLNGAAVRSRLSLTNARLRTLQALQGRTLYGIDGQPGRPAPTGRVRSQA